MFLALSLSDIFFDSVFHTLYLLGMQELLLPNIPQIVTFIIPLVIHQQHNVIITLLKLISVQLLRFQPLLFKH